MREDFSGIDTVCGSLLWTLQVPKNEKGRTYLRPATGTLESPRKDAFNAPPVGRTSKRGFSCPEISKVSLRTAAEATRNNLKF